MLISFNFFAAAAHSPGALRATLARQAQQAHRGHPYTFFCGYAFNEKRQIDLPGKVFASAAQQRVTWMPIVPYTRLGAHLGCWQSRCYVQGKHLQAANCCLAHHPQFRAAALDLHNIVPMVPAIAKRRGDLDFGALPTFEGEVISECDLRIDSKRRRVEPPVAQRGAIARAYLYMQHRHHLVLSVEESGRFMEWHRQYPPEPWEIEWDAAVARIQGPHNPYIAKS